MITEILDYRYCNDWNLIELFDDQFKVNVQPKFPLVVNTTSGLTSQTKIQQDYFVDKKRRGRPSDLRNSNRDSTVSFCAEQLELSGHVMNTGAECSGTLYAMHTATMLSLAYNTPSIVFSADNQIEDELYVWNYKSFGALDQETGRSFDKSSRGFRIGTGASLFLVKHPSVKFNTISPIATISNYTFYTNPSLTTNPGNFENVIANIKHINFNEIDIWNAHATGTPVGDKFEYEVFSSVIDKDIPIIGYKGHVGHCLSAAGGVEFGLMMDDYKNNVLRPNLIIGEKIINDDRIITQPIAFPGKRILKANFGFGGKNAICRIDIQ
jgi:3-oxoacyl-(acyl-carrier-protein) synthase